MIFVVEYLAQQK